MIEQEFFPSTILKARAEEKKKLKVGVDVEVSNDTVDAPPPPPSNREEVVAPPINSAAPPTSLPLDNHTDSHANNTNHVI